MGEGLGDPKGGCALGQGSLRRPPSLADPPGDPPVSGKGWGSLCELRAGCQDGPGAEASVVLNLTPHFQKNPRARGESARSWERKSVTYLEERRLRGAVAHVTTQSPEYQGLPRTWCRHMEERGRDPTAILICHFPF